MIPRKIAAVLKKAATQFPVLTLLGPRQSGKTTLVQFLFPDYHYINLENPKTRSFLREDPKSVLRNGKDRLIIDEALVKGFLARLYNAGMEPRELYPAYFDIFRNPRASPFIGTSRGWMIDLIREYQRRPYADDITVTSYLNTARAVSTGERMVTPPTVLPKSCAKWRESPVIRLSQQA